MAYALNYSATKNDLKTIESGLEDVIAYAENDEWEISSHTEVKKYISSAEETGVIDISCVDVTSKDSIFAAESLRKISPDAMLMIIADLTVPPTAYMKPSIEASSLMLKPLDEKTTKASLKELLFAYEARMKKKDEGSSEQFCVNMKNEKRYIYYDDIFYFEAREKRIFLNTNTSELGFYDTLDVLQEQLLEHFVRSHRSFIVNSRKIERIVPSQKIIYLNNGAIVPLSRGYKDSVKQFMENDKND